MGPQDLAQVLSGLPGVTDPNVLVGAQTADDAAIYRLSAEAALVQTVDFFTPIVDSPYDFGAIAAANSLSDIYAMGGRPALALNIVCFPTDNPEAPLSALGVILRAGADKAREAGIDIVGGHTVADPEPKYGLCVTGFVHPERFWRNTGARPGDRLILTKPLGTGIIATAGRRGDADDAVLSAAIDSMSALNRRASETAQSFDVHACTDVTGFGFLGHLREMLAAGDIGARIELSAVPVLDGCRQLTEAGYVPGGSRRNLRATADVVTFDAAVSEVDRLILADAQTSGGLLLAIGADLAGPLCAALGDAGVSAADVGEITADPDGGIEVQP